MRGCRACTVELLSGRSRRDASSSDSGEPASARLTHDGLRRVIRIMRANRLPIWPQCLALLFLFSLSPGSTASAQTPPATTGRLETILYARHGRLDHKIPPGAKNGRESSACLATTLTIAAADGLRRLPTTDVRREGGAPFRFAGQRRPDWGRRRGGVGPVPLHSDGTLGKLPRRRRADVEDRGAWRRYRHRDRCADSRTKNDYEAPPSASRLHAVPIVSGHAAGLRVSLDF